MTAYMSQEQANGKVIGMGQLLPACNVGCLYN